MRTKVTVLTFSLASKIVPAVTCQPKSSWYSSWQWIGRGFVAPEATGRVGRHTQSGESSKGTFFMMEELYAKNICYYSQ